MIVFARRSLLAVTGFMSVCAFAACSAATETGAIATGGVDAAAIAVETSDLYVGIINNAGRPLEQVRVAIQIVGTSPPFTATINRMENGEKRELAPSSFRSNDGTTFSPRLHKARQVSVTAADIVGKKYEFTKPWKR